MQLCPKLSMKLIVLIKKALAEQVFHCQGTLNELINAYHLPPRLEPRNSNSEFTDVETYYQSVVLGLAEPTEQNANAAIILTALLSDHYSQSPVLSPRRQWMDSDTWKPALPPHLQACTTQLETEGVEFKNLVEFATPILRGDLMLTMTRPQASMSSNGVRQASPSSPKSPRKTQGDVAKVFIIHGHDALNAHKLHDFLKDELNLVPIIMSFQPGKGRTLIEKFEQEAEGTDFAFAILTPDDMVKSADGQYAQARPNVVFELGWFYGRLGRHNVCILLKQGTQIHSDLDGISRIEFGEDVTEKAIDIEKELRAARINVRQDRSN